MTDTHETLWHHQATLSKPSHYLNQWWQIDNWIIGSKFSYILIKIKKLSIQENVSKKVVCKMSAILFWHYCLKMAAFWSRTQGVNIGLIIRMMITSSWYPLTHCGLIKPYDNRDLIQYWLRYWLVTWQHQAIAWSDVHLSFVSFCGIYLVAISHRVPMLLFYIMKIIPSKLMMNLIS